MNNTITRLRPLCLVAMAAAIAANSEAAVRANLSPRAAAVSRALQSDSIVQAYLTVDPALLDRPALDSLGVVTGLDLGSTLTVRLPVSSLEALQGVSGIQYIQTASPARGMIDVARAEIGMGAVRDGQVSQQRPFTGKGVVVGIVDSGFDYTHPAFLGADGHLRIRRVWEQSTDASGMPVSVPRFGYGVELSDETAILNAGGDIRNNSHGTHVASLAAGRDIYTKGVLDGMAPDADIVLVSMCEAGASNVAISDAIAYIFEYADAVDKPCVVNLSLGSQSGPHDGTSTFDVIADALQGPGRLIVGAAGNHHNGGFHVQRKFDSAGDEALRTLLDYRLPPSEKNAGGDIEVWIEAGADMEVALVAYKTSTNEAVERQVVYPSSEAGAGDISLGRNITGTFSVACEQSPLNGKGHVVLSSGVKGIRTGYAIGIEVTPRSAGSVDIWADDYYLGFTDKGLEGLADPSAASTISEIGGTARNILSVGAYTTRPDYILLGESTTLRLDETEGDICSFSNYGPTADGRVKPDICSPGCFIAGAVSTHDASGTLQYAHVCRHNGADYYYGYMQGTSMATPIVTGTVAVWLEAMPELTPQLLKEVVSSTARSDNYTGALDTPDNHWGYGKIDALSGIEMCFRLAGLPGAVNDATGSATRIVNNGDGTITVAFTADCGITTVDVYSSQGMLVRSTAIGAVRAGQTYTIDTGTLPHGVYIVKCAGVTVKTTL